MTSKLIENDEVLKVCQIPEGLLPLISGSGFNSQLEFNHRRGIKVANFINQFMNIEQIKGKRILELGPGHYSFSLIAQNLGAEVVCVERNEGFIRLGKELGFEVANLDFGLDMDALRSLGKFDGLWAKGVYNAYNYNQQEMSSFFETIDQLLSNQGWGLFISNSNEVLSKISNFRNLVSKYENHNFIVNKIEIVTDGLTPKNIQHTGIQKYPRCIRVLCRHYAKYKF